MKTYESCFSDAFCNKKLEALDQMSESLEAWDINKNPEFPKEYIRASAVYYALREIETTAFDNFLLINKKDRP